MWIHWNGERGGACGYSSISSTSFSLKSLIELSLDEDTTSCSRNASSFAYFLTYSERKEKSVSTVQVENQLNSDLPDADPPWLRACKLHVSGVAQEGDYHRHIYLSDLSLPIGPASLVVFEWPEVFKHSTKNCDFTFAEVHVTCALFT